MFELLLGHLVGDYLLQNEWMAQNKSRNNGTGWMAALVHCLIYTLVIAVFMGIYDWYWFVVVFLTHFPIDKFGLAEKYMQYVKGKGMKDYVKQPIYVNGLNRYDILEGGFTAVVYTVTDNTMHLLLMWGAYKLIYL